MRVSDWSSDVCSSDLRPTFTAHQFSRRHLIIDLEAAWLADTELASGLGETAGFCPVEKRLQMIGVWTASRPPLEYSTMFGRHAVFQPDTIRSGASSSWRSGDRVEGRPSGCPALRRPPILSAPVAIRTRGLH